MIICLYIYNVKYPARGSSRLTPINVCPDEARMKTDSTHSCRLAVYMTACILSVCGQTNCSKNLQAAEKASGSVSVSVLVPEVIMLNYSTQHLSGETSPTASSDTKQLIWHVNGFSPGGNACVNVSTACTNPATGKTYTLMTSVSALGGTAKGRTISGNLGIPDSSPPAGINLITASTI